MACFEWISSRALPARFDLRARGWSLGAGGGGEYGCARLIDGAERAARDLASPALRRRSLVLGVASSEDRARCLERGYADALGDDVALGELEARARRLTAAETALVRRHGRLELDLTVRDALIEGRRLFLFPREFALLWRLTEANGQPVARAALLRDVLGRRFEPQTNALAVHVCRLRKKLHLARLAHLLVTAPGDGGYALVLERPAAHIALDARVESGEEALALEEAAR
jgi:DNA-binding winged helix-turn-helix (wHTH) protein